MKHGTMSAICRVLVVSLMMLSFQTAQAGMIGTGQVADTQRTSVMHVIDRADVSQQLQSMGLEPQVAKDRVAAMTDEEVRTLSGKLDTLPAGGMSDWWIGAIVVAIIAVAVWGSYGWKR